MEKKPSTSAIFGVHPVLEAIKSETEIDRIFIKNGFSSTYKEEIFKTARQKGVQVTYVPVEKIDRKAKNINHQGIMAETAVVSYADLEELLITLQSKNQVPALIMLDGVTDVRNFGSIARSAEAMGVQAIIIPKQGSARVTDEAIRTSAGALQHLPVCRVDHLADAIYILKSYDVKLLSMSEKAKELIFDVDLTPSHCLIMGSEQKGVSRRLQDMSDGLVKIPLSGRIASLNVAVAAGIGMAECARQRGIKK